MNIEEYDPEKDEMFQILDKDGNLVKDDPEIDEDILKDMYWWMVFGRKADEKALKLQRQGRMGTYPPIRGQEATQVGSTMALNGDDWVAPAFRELINYLMRGISLENNLLYFMGDIRGNDIPREINNLPMAVPVGTQLPHAAGIAYGMKLKGKNTAVLSYFGDGATSEGDFHEGMNFAGVMNAPLVAICQNNQYAISVPREKQTASKTIAQKAKAYGFPGVQIDGNDVLAVYLTSKDALERARRGDGPSLIEAFTYRMQMHTTADDPTRYRSEEELEKLEDKDPLKRFRIYLKNKGIWTEEWQSELEDKADEKIDEAIEKAENIESPEPDDMFEYMFDEMTPELKEQLKYLKNNLKEKEIEEEKVEYKGGFP